jgi:hypothetical protein
MSVSMVEGKGEYLGESKLESIGIRGSLLSWVKNCLSERKQRVVINNSTSSWRDINAGVPQGSILFCSLFS